MAFKIKRPCPRCGGGVERHADPTLYLCSNPFCCASWASGAALDNESIARDLSGTRASKDMKDWLPNARSITEGGVEDTGLGQELQSLVMLVRLETLREVEKGLTTAISGRDTKEYRDTRGIICANVEKNVLTEMLAWVRKLQSTGKSGQDE